MTDDIKLKPPGQPPHFALRGLLVAVVVAALVLALAVACNAPASATAISVALVLWVLRWKYRASAGGVAVLFTGAEAMVVAAFGVYRTEDGVGYLILADLGNLGALLCVAACIAFGIVAAKSAFWRRSNALCSVAAILLVVLWLTVLLPLGESSFGARIAQRNAENHAVMQTIIEDVEAIRSRLGRVPKDEEELVRLLGCPMPSVCRVQAGLPTPISYRRRGPSRYDLTFLDDEIYFYDSDAPTQGWTHIPF
ncbi:MAG: hypothetical protein ACYC35_24710 [Pirellulales bacterium]